MNGRLRGVLAQQFMFSMKFFLWAFGLMAAHRLLSFQNLLFAAPTPNPVKALAIGLASDLWIAALVSAAAMLPSVLLLSSSRAMQRYYAAWVFLLAVAAAGHQYYVSFFKHPAILLHLGYLTDLQFLQANGGDPFKHWEILLLLAGGPLLWSLAGGRAETNRRRRRPAGAAAAYAAVLALAALIHVLHIRYKEQWFIPPTLRYNAVESLAYQAVSQKFPSAWSQAEGAALENLLPRAPGSGSSAAARAGGWPMHATAIRMKERFAEAVGAGRKPLIVVVALESLRMADISPPGSDRSLTPALDSLRSQGHSFDKAFSTGNITRGAQEAILCGIFSGVNYSVMRREIELPAACLPGEANIRNIESFWYHGGHPLFDDQAEFWQRQGIHDLAAADAFPDEMPRTGWGIGDFSFFADASARLGSLRSKYTGKAFFGLILSVSNHIPWDLPADIPADTRAAMDALGLQHASYKTVLYSDRALGNFIEQMKSSGIWRDSLLIITGDHGTTVPPYNGDYPRQAELLLSHVPLVISGGLAERAPGPVGEDPESASYLTNTAVSHAQVAGFIAYILNLEAMTFSVPPLFAKVDWPIFVNLGEEFYFPRTGRTWRRSEVFRDHLPLDQMSSEAEKADLLFAKSYFFNLRQLLER